MSSMRSEILHPLQDNIGLVQLVGRSDDPTLSVVNAARVSYNNEKEKPDERDAKLVNFLWTHDHTSPFRHAFYTLKIKAPLFVMRQWWKHQIGCRWTGFVLPDGTDVGIDVAAIQVDIDNGCSWNEVSGRYVQLEEEFYVPKEFRGNAAHGNKQQSYELDWTAEEHEEMHQEFVDACADAYIRYKDMLSRGVAREQARMLLPQNIYTSTVWTCSVQSLLHFLNLRLKSDAQYEIRRYAEAIRDIVKDDLIAMGVPETALEGL